MEHRTPAGKILKRSSLKLKFIDYYTFSAVFCQDYKSTQKNLIFNGKPQ